MTKRCALVIGVNAYPAKELSNPIRDTHLVQSTLRLRGFQTTVLEDPEIDTIENALKVFSHSAIGKEMALIYFAGHAVEYHGYGYILPSNFELPISTGKLLHCAISINSLVETARKATSAVIVIDACRNWPADEMAAASIIDNISDLIPAARNWSNLLLSYSTSASTTASDGEPGHGTAFCNSFCERMLLHGINIEECFRLITQDVTYSTGLGQQPWTYSSVVQRLSFSDLPLYKTFQRYSLPILEGIHGMGWCISNLEQTEVFVGTGGKNAWRVRSSSHAMISYNGNTKIVGAIQTEYYMVFCGENGELFLSASQEPLVTLDVDTFVCLILSPDKKHFIQLSLSSATIFACHQDQFLALRNVDIDFEAYCCCFISNNDLWVAGWGGNIVSVDISTGEVSFLTELNGHTSINAMAVSPDGEVVFCVDQSGSIVSLNKIGADEKTIMEPRPYQTPAGIREALENHVLPNLIEPFIFDPNSIPGYLRRNVEEILGTVSLSTCAHAPNIPLLAVGTGESTILLVDTRDGQISQEIDIISSHPNAVTSLLFLSDYELVALGAEGQLIFIHGSGRPNSFQRRKIFKTKDGRFRTTKGKDFPYR